MPIVELIAQAIETRLKAIRGSYLSRVYRPTQHDEETTLDKQVILCERETENTGYLAGNPPRTIWRTVWDVKCQLADEGNTKSIDRRKYEILDAVTVAICDAANDWYTFGGLATDTEILGPEVIQESGATVVKIPLEVMYRTSEHNPSVQG